MPVLFQYLRNNFPFYNDVLSSYHLLFIKILDMMTNFYGKKWVQREKVLYICAVDLLGAMMLPMFGELGRKFVGYTDSQHTNLKMPDFVENLSNLIKMSITIEVRNLQEYEWILPFLEMIKKQNADIKIKYNEVAERDWRSGRAAYVQFLKANSIRVNKIEIPNRDERNAR